LRHGVLSVPPPFYLQRLISTVGRGGVLRPAQVLRAYVVGGQVAFWTERYRDKIRRPADFIISATFGARYRFVRAVGDSVDGLARRAADALGVRIGAIDLLRAGDDGPFVLEADTDGQHVMIDRSFKALPEYRDVFDFDRMIADALLTPAPETRAADMRHDAEPRAPRPRATRDSRTEGVERARGRVAVTRSDRVRTDRPRVAGAAAGAEGRARRQRTDEPRAATARPRASWSAPRGSGSGIGRPQADAPPRPARPRPPGLRAGGSGYAGPRTGDGPRPGRPRGAGPGFAAPRSSGPRNGAARFTGPRTGGGPRPGGPRNAAPRGVAPGGAGPRSGGTPRPGGPRGGAGFGGPRAAGAPRAGGPRADGPRSGGPRGMGPRNGPRRGGPPHGRGGPSR